MTDTPLSDKPDAHERERLLREACEQYEKAVEDNRRGYWSSATAHLEQARALVASAGEPA